MARVITVTDESGKEYTINTDNIVSIEHEAGEPGEPAVEAQDAVEDDPGEEPSPTNPMGRPPTKGHPKIEAKEAVPGTPDKATIKLVGGDSVKVLGSSRDLRNAIG